MKLAKIFAIALVLVLAITAFSGCTARDRDNTTSSVPPIVNSMPDLASRIEEGVSDFASGVEHGISGLEEDFGMSRDESYNESYPDHDDNSHINSDYDLSDRDLDRSELTDESVAAAMSTDFSEIGALGAESITGFPGGPVDSRNRPAGPLAYQEKYKDLGAYFIVPDSDKIYLTFDEGYENGYTSRILDILKEKNVKAVFFITYPYAKSEPALVRRMIEEGHTLGNHSTKHLIYPDMPLTEAAKDLLNLHEYVLAQYGYKMSLFRPPEGAFSEQTLALCKSLNYNVMLWSFAYKDYDTANQPIAIEALDNMLKKAHPGEIMLLHAVSRTNSEILGEAIDALRAKDFVFADYFYFQ